MDAAILIVSLFMNEAVPSIRNYDPPPAAEWHQSVTFDCNGLRVVLSDFGTVRPVNRRARILVNGTPLAGSSANSLIADLSDKRAVYRIESRCPKERAIGLLIYKAVNSEQGRVTYSAGVALIKAGQLARYEHLRTIDENSFWHR